MVDPISHFPKTGAQLAAENESLRRDVERLSAYIAGDQHAERRERIATACLAGLCAGDRYSLAHSAERAVEAADALIEALDRKEKA